jgi:electron transport complex protein RnfB
VAPRSFDRREALRTIGRWLLGAGGLLGAGALLPRARSAACAGGAACAACPELSGCAEAALVPRIAVSATPLVWQLDPKKCVQCGQCATRCVLTPSAVTCAHSHAICGYCKLCFGYFQPGVTLLTEAAENQLCPTGAIRRTLVEHPYYEYLIDRDLCIGCGKCVKGCTTFGNGSLQLQVRHDRCLNCNECSIARDCPADAWRRVPADRPYLLKAEAKP